MKSKRNPPRSFVSGQPLSPFSAQLYQCQSLNKLSSDDLVRLFKEAVSALTPSRPRGRYSNQPCSLPLGNQPCSLPLSNQPCSLPLANQRYVASLLASVGEGWCLSLLLSLREAVWVWEAPERRQSCPCLSTQALDQLAPRPSPRGLPDGLTEGLMEGQPRAPNLEEQSPFVTEVCCSKFHLAISAN